MQQPWQLVQRSNFHNNPGLDAIRIFLGLALFVRGCLFIADQSRIMSITQAQDVDWILPVAAIHFVTLAHLLGGFMMMVGLLTKVGALIQIPILLGALYVHFEGGLAAPEQSLELSVLVLFLLCVIAYFGAGIYSLDRRIMGQSDTDVDEDIEELSRASIEQSVVRKRESSTAAMEDAVAHSASTIPTAGGNETYVVETDNRESQISKYLGIFFFSGLLLVIGLQGIPAGVSFDEFAGVAGVVVFVLGIFYLFYRTAFK